MITDEQREKIVDRFKRYSGHFPNWYSCDALIAKTFTDVLGIYVSDYDYEQIMDVLADLIECKTKEFDEQSLLEVADWIIKNSDKFNDSTSIRNAAHKIYMALGVK